MAKISDSNKKKTIILIAGIFDFQWEIKPIYNIAKSSGFNCEVFRFPTWGTQSYFEVEKKLEAFVREHKPAGIIGFSTGGMLALGAKHNLPVLAICAPFSGTATAYLWNTIGIKQLRYGSDYLKHVAEGAKRKKNVLSVITYLDLTVIPGTSGRVGVSTWSLSPLHSIVCFWPHTKSTVSSFMSSL